MCIKLIPIISVVFQAIYTRPLLVSGILLHKYSGIFGIAGVKRLFYKVMIESYDQL